MYLLVNPNGSKYFRLDYRFAGLKQAREKRDTARKQIGDGIDPNANKKAVKQAKAASVANSFEVVAREWYERNMSDKSDSHKKRTLANLERDVYPWLGNRLITDIKAPDLLTHHTSARTLST